MTSHVRQPLRMIGRMPVRSCSCGDPWPCRVATGDARWQELRDYLTADLRANREVSVSCSGADLQPTKDFHDGMVKAQQEALATMRRLEEGQ